jgi:hypothetical protein
LIGWLRWHCGRTAQRGPDRRGCTAQITASDEAGGLGHHVLES